jgi:hypothetical protein
MRPPRAYFLVRHLFEVYSAVFLGFVILAVLIPAVVSARDTARRAVCTNVLRQHSGSCPDTVCLERGRIVWVSRCWNCGSKPDNRICFVKEKDGKLLSSEQALLEGVAVIGEVLERLRQYKLDFCERSTAGANPSGGYGPRDEG